MAAPPNPRRQFEEYRTLEYLLLGDFRSALEDAEDESGHTWLMAVMDALLDALPRKPGVTRAVANAAKTGATAAESAAESAVASAANVARTATLAKTAARTVAESAVLEPLCAEQEALRTAFQDRRAVAAEKQQFLSDRHALVNGLIDWLGQINDHNRRWVAAVEAALRALDGSP